jgi:hypothetical protein
MDIEVSRLKVDETEFRFVQNERCLGADSSTIEIYDSKGELRGKFKYYGNFPNGHFIDNEGKKYEIRPYHGPSEKEAVPYVIKDVPVSEKDSEKTLE